VAWCGVCRVLEVSVPRLLYRDINGTEQTISIYPGMDPVTIGRNPGSSIYSKDSTVSRNHGRIGHDPAEGYYIKDLGSSNGTFLNGEQCKRGIIRPGDVVRCGEVFEISLLEDAESPPQRRSAAPAQAPQRPQGHGPSKPPLPTVAASGKDAISRADVQAAVAARAAQLSRPTTAASAQIEQQAAHHAAQQAARDVLRDVARPATAGGVMTGKSSVVEQNRVPPAQSAPPPPQQRAPTPSQPIPVVTSGPTPDGDALRRKVASLEQQGADAQARVATAERQSKEAEARAMRYSVELDGLSDKYVKLKEHVSQVSSALEQTRRDLREKEDHSFELERKVRELESQSESNRTRASESQEQISGLKVRITQKDRQIEELQRQLDLLEYELRNSREEMENFKADFNREGGDLQRLERKVNMLQEIIDEKESIIQGLRMDLQDKDIEIRQVRMGVGISDLESEKRRLLEDFHSTTRRVDELNDRLLSQSRQIDDLRGQLDKAKSEAAERKTAPVDISDHPTLKAKSREIERLTEALGVAEMELTRAKAQLTRVDPDAIAKLEAELTVLRMKCESLQQRVDVFEAREVAAAQEAEKNKIDAGAVAEFADSVFALEEAAQAAEMNAKLVRRYTGNLESDSRDGKLNPESIELLTDIAVVLTQDLGEVKRALSELAARLKDAVVKEGIKA